MPLSSARPASAPGWTRITRTHLRDLPVSLTPHTAGGPGYGGQRRPGQGRALVPRSAEIPVTGTSRDRLSALVSSGRLRIAGSAPESLSPHPARSASPAASSVENDVTKTPVTKTPVTKTRPKVSVTRNKGGRPKKETTLSRSVLTRTYSAARLLDIGASCHLANVCATASRCCGPLAVGPGRRQHGIHDPPYGVRRAGYPGNVGLCGL
jgi:hypothetical protein